MHFENIQKFVRGYMLDLISDPVNYLGESHTRGAHCLIYLSLSVQKFETYRSM